MRDTGLVDELNEKNLSFEWSRESFNKIELLIKKYPKAANEVATEHTMRKKRLIEKMTLGRNAVAYLTESLHGAGSPQAQRVQISRRVDIEEKKSFAKKLAGIEE